MVSGIIQKQSEHIKLPQVSVQIKKYSIHLQPNKRQNCGEEIKATLIYSFNTPVSRCLEMTAVLDKRRICTGLTSIQKTVRAIQKCFYCFMSTFFCVLVDICE